MTCRSTAALVSAASPLPLPFNDLPQYPPPPPPLMWVEAALLYRGCRAVFKGQTDYDRTEQNVAAHRHLCRATGVPSVTGTEARDFMKPRKGSPALRVGPARTKGVG